MKSALQDEDNNENVPRDAKGREILSPEEKAKREEKSKRVAAEVSKFVSLISINLHYTPFTESYRKETAR